MKLMKTAAVVVLACLITACAGTNFVRPADNAFSLGHTTEEQVIAQMGKPYSEGKVTKHGQVLDSSVYSYAGGSASLVGGITPARSAGFYYLNGTLVGQEFASSYEEDSTDFDESKISSIQIGKSTKSDVIALLGKPGGNYIFPLVANEDEAGLAYLYSQVKGSVFNLQIHQKLLIISLDKSGIVTDVNFTSVGEK